MKSYYRWPIETHHRSFEEYHPRPLRPPVPQDWDSQPQPKTAIAIISISQERVKLYELQILYAHSWYRSEQKPITNF